MVETLCYEGEFYRGCKFGDSTRGGALVYMPICLLHTLAPYAPFIRFAQHMLVGNVGKLLAPGCSIQPFSCTTVAWATYQLCAPTAPTHQHRRSFWRKVFIQGQISLRFLLCLHKSIDYRSNLKLLVSQNMQLDHQTFGFRPSTSCIRISS